MSSSFEILAYSPFVSNSIQQTISAINADATGVIDLAYVDQDSKVNCINFLHENRDSVSCDGSIGIRLRRIDLDYINDVIKIYFDRNITFIILDVNYDILLKLYEVVNKFENVRVLIEVFSIENLRLYVAKLSELNAEKWGLILSGKESGGFTGNTSSFLMMQEALKYQGIQMFLRGGIGVHSATAAKLLGFKGVVLDDQLLFLKESPLTTKEQYRLKGISIQDTAVYGEEFVSKYRGVYHQSFQSVKRIMNEILISENKEDSNDNLDRWEEYLAWGDARNKIWPIGQSIDLAKDIGKKYKTTGRYIQYLKNTIDEISEESISYRDTLHKGAELSIIHGAEYPIVQGPMTRVSDSPEFAKNIHDNGALPFIALAVNKRDRVESLLKQTHARLKGKSWGVGLLGFIDPNLLQSQLEVVYEYKPSYAILAGGQASQVQELEEKGISTYIHAPTPKVLSHLIKNDCRKFVFEGRECGGHVGPIHSLVLWDQVIDILINEIPESDWSKVQVLFAGGIHDKYSSSIITCLSIRLRSKGMKCGVLMGTAYLGTEEAVSSTAITSTFQNVILEKNNSVLLRSAIGHANRCIDSPFVNEFNSKRRELIRKGESSDKIQEELDGLLLGRLRLASKGEVKQDDVYKSVDDEVQIEQGMFMSGDVARFMSKKQTLKELHEEVSNGSELINSNVKQKEVVESSTKPANIAIVGMSVHVPGSNELDEYFEQILSKRQSLIEIPKDRWDWELYYDSDKNAPDKIYSKWGGFIDEIEFDPLEYGIPPKSVPNISVAQLLSLEVVKKGLENAGYEPDELDKENVSVIFAGADAAGFLGDELVVRSCANLYANLELDKVNNRLPGWTEETFPGIITNVVAGRVANRFDFGGSNYTVDAACASSLVALNNGVRELTSNRSNLVIVGGVEMGQTPHGYLSFSKTQALSSKGQSIPFDKDADGIVISEGLAVLVLKRLEDAERDGDTIYSVIKGIAGSSDGKAMGMTAPRPVGQKRALNRSYNEAGFDVSTIGLYEAHGTGTPVGDEAELKTIYESLIDASTEEKSVCIGSVKNLIGHTKITAGLVSTVKAALALHHKILPAQGGLTDPREELIDQKSPIYFNSEPTYWDKPIDHSRRAGVSAFGFGGTNYHLALEEYNQDIHNAFPQVRPAELFLFKGKDNEDLIGQMTNWQITLESLKDIDFASLSYSINNWSERNEADVNLAIVATELGDLKSQLDKTLKSLSSSNKQEFPKRVFLSKVTEVSGKTALLFPGQGTQYLNMGRELGIYFPHFGKNSDCVNQSIGANYTVSLSKLISPYALADSTDLEKRQEALNNTHIAQPAIGWLSKSYFDLIQEFDIEFNGVAGHSYGEYTALLAAGVLTEEDYFQLSETRGRLMAKGGEESGTMAAILIERDYVEKYLEDNSIEQIILANHNHRKQVVISGDKNEVLKAVDYFESKGITTFQLPVSGAFHSGLMKSAQQPLAEAIDDREFQLPTKEIYSNSTAELYPTGLDEIKAQLKKHLLEPVEFVKQIERMYEDGYTRFIELGPKNVLSKCVKSILEGKEFESYAVEEFGQDYRAFLMFIADFWSKGIVKDTEVLYRGRKCRIYTMQELKNLALKKPKQTSWIVNGTRAVAVNEQFNKKRKEDLLTVESKKKETQEIQLSQQPSNPVPMEKKYSRIANNSTLDAYQAYQNTMTQFLKTQEVVMNAFLNGDNIEVDESAIVPSKEAVDEKISFEKKEENIVQNDVNEILELEVSMGTAESKLLGIVADRTGYPIELLDVNLDIEAELGIDSIKRVEIFDEMLKGFSQEVIAKIKQNSREIVQSKYLQDWIRLFDQYWEGGIKGSSVIDSKGQAEIARSIDSKEQLVNIISDQTGYPIEMIDENVDLEAELGIDSIKRIEIFDLFLNTLSETDKVLLKSKGQAIVRKKSIAEWCKQIDSELNHSIQEGREDICTEESEEVAVNEIEKVLEPRYLMEPRIEELPKHHKAPISGLYLIIPDEDSLVAEKLISSLEEFGAFACEIPKDVYTDYLILKNYINDVRDLFGPVQGIVHLAALKSKINLGNETIEEFNTNSKSLFNTLRVCSNDFNGNFLNNKSIIAVSSFGGYYGRDGESKQMSPLGGSHSGILKSLEYEWEKILPKTIDFELGENPNWIVNRILNEIQFPNSQFEIGYKEKRRYVFKPVHKPLLNKKGTSFKVESGWVILITGGARGITAEIAKKYAIPGARFVLVGNGVWDNLSSSDETSSMSSDELKQYLLKKNKVNGVKVTPAGIEKEIRRILRDREITSNIEYLRRKGVWVTYKPCDVSDSESFGNLIDEVYEEYDRLDMVIHGAGMIDDKYLVDKDEESFDRVFNTKVNSSLTLYKKLKLDQLKSLIFFSSTAGRFGNKGQADYAAANEVLNRLAWKVKAEYPKILVKSFNWGPWSGVGMASSVVNDQFIKRGILPIAPEDGVSYFYQELKSGEDSCVEVVLGQGTWDNRNMHPIEALFNEEFSTISLN